MVTEAGMAKIGVEYSTIGLNDKDTYYGRLFTRRAEIPPKAFVYTMVCSSGRCRFVRSGTNGIAPTSNR